MPSSTHVIHLLLATAVISFTACDRSQVAAAPAATPTVDANVASEAPAASASHTLASDLDPYEGVAKLEGNALKAALPVCGADYWLAGDFQTRLAELKALGIACREVASDSGHKARCTLPAGTRSFGGYAVEGMEVFDEDGLHEATFTVRAPADTLASAMAKDTQTELTAFGNSAGMYENQIDDRFRYIVWSVDGDPHRSLLNCQMHDVGANAAAMDQREDDHNIPAGSIAGDIRYPNAEVPAMRICAVYRGGMMYGCTQTKRGQTHYRIDHLAPAEGYVVMASIADGEWPIGGNATPLPCEQAPCPDAELEHITIGPGEGVDGIHLNLFVHDADSWPPMPVEDDM